MSLIFRAGTVDDAKALADLHAENWKLAYKDDMSTKYLEKEIIEERLTYWTKTMRSDDPHCHVIIAEDSTSNLLAGFVCYYSFYEDRTESYIHNLHVYPRHRGEGLGRTLMEKSIAHLKRDYPEQLIYLWVLTSNVAARKFYKKIDAIEKDTGTWHMPGGGEGELIRCVWE